MCSVNLEDLLRGVPPHIHSYIPTIQSTENIYFNHVDMYYYFCARAH